eukprot:TRINITY_DN8176_c0_g1_i1.p1 TRINITY_DN8176_c0_g1~~TRINITY_DN8176_c0_g1_i1.p1  ORF type:complete len:124 (+),score=7.74 TRINITY_DN8176_c0_g1_i1:420-791(+)
MIISQSFYAVTPVSCLMSKAHDHGGNQFDLNEHSLDSSGNMRGSKMLARQSVGKRLILKARGSILSYGDSKLRANGYNQLVNRRSKRTYKKFYGDAQEGDFHYLQSQSMDIIYTHDFLRRRLL